MTRGVADQQQRHPDLVEHSRRQRVEADLVHGMLVGGDCIDDVDLLGCAATGTVLGHRVMAPFTVETFLRAFTFGHTASSTRSTSRSSPARGRLAPALARGP